MIETFLRRPQTPGEYAADLVRVIGVLSVVVAGLWWSATDAGVLALVLPALVLPRFLGVHPAFDVVYGLVLLLAGWSNIFDLYRSIAFWDLLVHFFCTGVFAAMVYVLLARLDIVPPPGTHRFTLAAVLALTTILGLAASAVWEMVEWVGHNFISDQIFVAYDDTIGDMTVGGIGAVLAGVALRYLPLYRGWQPAAQPRDQRPERAARG